MRNPFAKSKYSNEKNKADILKAWHSELSDINKENLAKAVSRFDPSNPQFYIHRNTEQPRSDLESGAYIDHLEKTLRWLDSNIEELQQIRVNIPKAIRILLAPGEKNSGRRKWKYYSIRSLSEETLQLMKKIVPYLSLEESKNIIDELKKTRSLFQWQESQLRTLRPKIFEAIRREKNIKSLPRPILSCLLIGLLLGISYVYAVKVAIPISEQIEAEERSRFSQTLDGMMSSGRCTEKRNLHIWMCSRHQTIGSPTLSSSPILGYPYRETIYYFGDGENEPYTSVKVLDYRADCEGCPHHKSQERIDLRER